MKLLSPFHTSPEESLLLSDHFHEAVKLMNVSDEVLEKYVNNFLAHYRATIEKFFYSLADLIPFYAQYPFATFILRWGSNGVIIGHRPNNVSTLSILRPQDFAPPLETLNIFKVVEYWQTPFARFDFTVRKYDAEEAELEGKKQALHDALEYFWRTVNEKMFSKICSQLLIGENVELQLKPESSEGMGFDVLGQVLFQEPASFRRFEKWAFEFKQHKENRISVNSLRQIESYLENNSKEIDIVCLVTSGDLTSVGRHVAIENPRIRIWDREVLNLLVNKHLNILKPYFAEYKIALDKLSQKPDIVITSNKYEEFSLRLKDCPTGKRHSTLYENIGIELWQYLFPTKLGKPKPQSKTKDRKQRRDVLFRNQRTGRFYQRIAEKFNADFVIIDFKNYAEPIESHVINDVTKYANKAIGTFIIIMCRAGAHDTATATQMRILRDSNILVLVVSDKQMLEMVVRKEKGENPEDLIEDIMDELLTLF